MDLLKDPILSSVCVWACLRVCVCACVRPFCIGHGRFDDCIYCRPFIVRSSKVV